MPSALSWPMLENMKQPSDPTDKARPSAYREKNSTADRALDILGLFSGDRLSVSAVDVAAQLGVARSTAYRYLLTLTSAGYLEEDPSGGFRLGLKVFELARIARASYGLSQVALPILRELSAQTGETVLLTKRSGTRAVCLEREEPADQRMRVSYERGSALTLNAGASAFVLLAWERPSVLDLLLDQIDFPEFTEKTLTTKEEVLGRLKGIRETGFAVTRGELDPDAVGIAAPVRDDQDRVVAGLSIVAVSRRVPKGVEKDLVVKVREAAQAISNLLSLTSQ